MKTTKKIITIMSSLFILGLFIFTPNFTFAEKNNNCKNAYISNVLPGANYKINSFKYFLFELNNGVNKNSVEFYINKKKQKVNLVKKENGTGYLALIKADQNLNKPGTLLLEIAASGSNENKCNANLFVGLEIKKSPKPPLSTTSIIKNSRKKVVSNLSNIKTITKTNKKNTLPDISKKEYNKQIDIPIKIINNKTIPINNPLNADLDFDNKKESPNIFKWITITLIVVSIALLLKPKKKNKIVDKEDTIV